jgi:hypothetical protein
MTMASTMAASSRSCSRRQYYRALALVCLLSFHGCALGLSGLKPTTRGLQRNALSRAASFAAKDNATVAPKTALSRQPNLQLSGFPSNGVNPPARDSQLQQSETSVEGERASRIPIRKMALSVLAITALSVGIGKRKGISLLLSQIDLSGLHRWLLGTLGKLNETGNAGLALYAFVFALWTITVGVTTPIETAGGFVFGAKRAIVANAFGTLGGAHVAVARASQELGHECFGNQKQILCCLGVSPWLSIHRLMVVFGRGNSQSRNTGGCT